jgi:FtsH-binding integral membrane protein
MGCGTINLDTDRNRYRNYSEDLTINNPAIVTETRSHSSALATNKVIRNTYMLLSMTLVFSALTAGISMTLNLLTHPGLLKTR